MKPLTARQREVYDYIVKSFAERGIAPSLTEIGRLLGCSSLATCHKHVENLIRKGYVAKARGESRSIQLLSPAGACPVCGALKGEAATC